MMGYDSTIAIVSRTAMDAGDGDGCFCETLATVEMCRTDIEFLKLFDKKFQDFFFFPGDGNTRIKEDDYGKAPTEASIERVYNWLGRQIFDAKHAGINVYRRYDMLFHLLEHFIRGEHWPNEEIVVVHYGH